MATTKWLRVLSFILVLVLVSGCVGRDSPLSLLNTLAQRGAQMVPGAQTPTPSLPVTPTPTLPLIVTAIQPTPTQPTATATLPATVVSAEPDAVVSGNTDVNLRTGPGTNFGVAGTASPGDPLTILGRNLAASWFHVETQDGVQAWVFGPLIVLNVDALDLPLAEEPPTPAGGVTSGQTTTGGPTPAGAPGGPLEVSWGIVGVPAVDETTAYHTINIYVQGGRAPFTYYQNDQPLSGSQFVLEWVRCGPLVTTTIRVDSADGQSVTKTIGFNAFCPTPFGCNNCTPWAP